MNITSCLMVQKLHLLCQHKVAQVAEFKWQQLELPFARLIHLCDSHLGTLIRIYLANLVVPRKSCRCKTESFRLDGGAAGTN